MYLRILDGNYTKYQLISNSKSSRKKSICFKFSIALNFCVLLYIAQTCWILSINLILKTSVSIFQMQILVHEKILKYL